MSIELITILMFGSMLFLLLMGLPVAFSCGVVGVIFTALLQGPSAVNIVPTRIFGLMVNYLLAAIPLFIFMACILERGGLIAEIYEMTHQWLGWLKGGVATASVAACTMMAAMVGVIGASEVTMGVIAFPEMLRRRYDKYMAAGSILAGGTLGILIPPSVMLIVYGMVDNVSIGQLYAGAFMPGFLLAALYILYISIRCYRNPRMGPPIPKEERLSFARKMKISMPIIPAAILIFLVLGTILIGIAAPTEAAGVGCAGAIIIIALQGKLKWKGVVQACETTLKSSAMVLWTMFGANVFVALYVMVGGGRFVTDVLVGSGFDRWIIMFIMQFILIFLGCFIDWVGIVMLCVPIFGPIVRQLGFDPVWFGVLFTVNLQMSFLSPPFGYALFYLKGVAPPEISTTDIWKGAAPFLGLQFVGLLLCMAFPDIILIAPKLLFRG
ncbi:MAG TPA: TRAP transporter large permease subunit [Thermodesulfobacteriota bacterium]|nr:TRAP transporter large permease subunit [Thermodesulfobacteriota bacterium]